MKRFFTAILAMATIMMGAANVANAKKTGSGTTAKAEKAKTFTANVGLGLNVGKSYTCVERTGISAEQAIGYGSASASFVWRKWASLHFEGYFTSPGSTVLLGVGHVHQSSGKFGTATDKFCGIGVASGVNGLAPALIYQRYPGMTNRFGTQMGIALLYEDANQANLAINANFGVTCQIAKGFSVDVTGRLVGFGSRKGEGNINRDELQGDGIANLLKSWSVGLGVKKNLFN